MRSIAITIGVVVIARLVAGAHVYLLWLGAAAALLCVGAATLARRYAPAARRARNAADTDPIPAEAARRLSEAGLGDAIEGVRVALRGTVACDEPLAAPFSGAKCAAYRLDVEVSREPRGLLGARWVSAPPERRSTPFRLRDGEEEITVLPEGAHLELKPAATRRFVRAQALQSPLRDLLPALDAVADQEVKVLRVRESTLPVGATAHVWGALQGYQGSTALGAAPEEDDAAFVISDAPPEELGRRAAVERRQAGLVAVGCLVAAALLGWYGSERMYVERHRGRMHVRNGTAQKVTVRLCSGRPEDGTWHYDPYEDSSKTMGSYLTDKGRDVLVAPGDRLTVSAWKPIARNAALGDGSLVEWNAESRTWTLNLEPALFEGERKASPVPEKAVSPERQGEVYVRNLSKRQVKIYYRPQGREAVPGYWTFKPGRGREMPQGVRLLDDGKPHTAGAGDFLLLEIGEMGTEAVRLGDKGPAVWRERGGNWYLVIDDALAEAPAGVLRVRNRTDYTVRLTLQRPDGDAYGSYWSFKPGEGSSSATGLDLQVKRVDVIFRGNDRIGVSTALPGPERPLSVGDDPEPVWRPVERCWLLDLKGDGPK